MQQKQPKKAQAGVFNLRHPDTMNVYSYHDALVALSENRSVGAKLELVHREMRVHFPFIDRIAVAIYEDERDLLKTFVYSSDDNTPLQFYHSELKNSVSLSEIVRCGEARVVNDMSAFAAVKSPHSERLSSRGYGASYTTPFYNDGSFAGFVFLNSYTKNVFTPTICSCLSPFVHLVSLMVLKEMDQVKILFGSVSSALSISHHRDPETGAHLERMSRYARLIANELAPRYGLDDEFVEFVYRFAPLHDVGKIAIPDRILLKPGPLSEEEYAEMQQHTIKGREIMERMLDSFRLQGLRHATLLRNIVELHHEAVDGSGYPNGFAGDAIPLEARIVAVADIFDALTSIRPYKEAWSNDAAYAELERLSGNKLDPQCVFALRDNRTAVEEIQRKFRDDPLG